MLKASIFSTEKGGKISAEKSGFWQGRFCEGNNNLKIVAGMNGTGGGPMGITI